MLNSVLGRRQTDRPGGAGPVANDGRQGVTATGRMGRPNGTGMLHCAPGTTISQPYRCAGEQCRTVTCFRADAGCNRGEGDSVGGLPEGPAAWFRPKSSPTPMACCHFYECILLDGQLGCRAGSNPGLGLLRQFVNSDYLPRVNHSGSTSLGLR